METEGLLTAVPEDLKRLVRLIVRGFYAMEHTVVIDMLVRHPCMKEDDLSELLRFEKKHLRVILNALKNDKLLKSRMRVETDEQGRTTRHSFYFINYSLFVNVVKYKLDHMRRKIEMDERDNTSRSSFICPGCRKTYTDYEVGLLLDQSTGELICTICSSLVEEDESSVPKEDARTTLARFNEQIQPIYDLLRVCENIKLAPEVLEPEPVELKHILNRSTGSSRSQQEGDRSVWSGDATRGVGFGATENRVTITMDDDKAGKVEKRDQPVWMTQSTVDGSSLTENTSLENKLLEPEKHSRGASGGDDILQTLLVHEPTAGPSKNIIPVDSDQEGGNDDDEDVEEMGSDDDDDDGGPMVSIGSARVPYNSITSDMVASMTPLEKNEYIRIGQQLYENMYD